MRIFLPDALLIAALFAAPVVPAAGGATAAPLLHSAARWPVAGEGGWDYVLADGTSRRLYLSHGTGVDVLDLDRGTTLGRIDSTAGVHGIAVAHALHRGFITCGRDSSLLIFDLDHLRPLGRVPVPGRNPDAVLYEPSSRRVLTFNGGTANVTVVDATTGAIVGTVAVGGKPEFAVDDGRGKVFVNIEDTSELLELDPATLKVGRRWSVAPGEQPTGLAIDLKHRRLFSVCGNRTMVVSDADQGKVVATLPIGAGVDGVIFDPRRGLAISSNGEGTITVVRELTPSKFTVVETDSTEPGARTIALDEGTGAIYLPTAELGPPPAPTPDRPHPRPTILPGTFHVLMLRP
jgi:DNA-binding beta-propeller fold protein YncE